MPTLLIIHHTPSPALQAMFEAVASGAQTDEIEGVEVAVRPALTAAAADVLAADGYLLGTPVRIALRTPLHRCGEGGWHPMRGTQDGLMVMNIGHDAPPNPRDDRTPHYRPGDLKKAESMWRGLRRDQRREVLRLARHGDVHPDPAVANIAYHWALIKSYVGERNMMAKPALAVPLALIMLFVPGGGGWAGGTIQYWKTLRAARRVVRVTENSRSAGGDAG